MAKRDLNSGPPAFTPKQGQYLAFIHAYTQLHGRPPAEADLQAHFGVTPPSVHQMILTLEGKGLVARRPYEARSLRLLVPAEVLPPLSRAAGRPSLAVRGPARPARVWRPDPKLLKVSPALRREVEASAATLLEEFRPQVVLPPPAAPRWNYVVELFTRWHGRFFYFMKRYACPAPNAISPFFDVGFARLEYAGLDRFHLAYHRHTGQWWQVGEGLTLEECLREIRENPLLQS